MTLPLSNAQPPSESHALLETLTLLGWAVRHDRAGDGRPPAWMLEARRGAEIARADGPHRDGALAAVLERIAAALGEGWYVLPVRNGAPDEPDFPVADLDAAKVRAAIALGRGDVEDVRIVRIAPGPSRAISVRRDLGWIPEG